MLQSIFLFFRFHSHHEQSLALNIVNAQDLRSSVSKTITLPLVRSQIELSETEDDNPGTNRSTIDHEVGEQ